MMKINLLAAAFALVSLVPQGARAARFTNQFVEFELPPQWQCNLEGAEWVCQSSNEEKKRDAIIVLAAKLKGDQDSLDQYLAYLKGTKNYTSVQGRPVKSDPKYAKIVQINEHAWVDSLHLESEVPGFYTRYIATVKSDIGVLVTYSINKAKYQDYLDQFDNMVKTLKVFRRPGGINTNSQQSLFENLKIPQKVEEGTIFGANNPTGGADAPAGKPKQEDDMMLYLIGGLAVVGFILWKKKQSSG